VRLTTGWLLGLPDLINVVALRPFRECPAGVSGLIGLGPVHGKRHLGWRALAQNFRRKSTNCVGRGPFVQIYVHAAVSR
jgi:hypothetical protein